MLNLENFALDFGYQSVMYLSFEPLTSYAKQVVLKQSGHVAIEVFPIETSQCNALRHEAVPFYRVLTEEATRQVERRFGTKREFFPRLPKSDAINRWAAHPAHGVVLEVPHMGNGQDASRFCMVLAVNEGDEPEGDEPEGAE